MKRYTDPPDEELPSVGDELSDEVKRKASVAICAYAQRKEEEPFDTAKELLSMLGLLPQETLKTSIRPSRRKKR